MLCLIGMLPKINDTIKTGNPGKSSMMSCAFMLKYCRMKLVTLKNISACQRNATNDMIAEIK